MERTGENVQPLTSALPSPQLRASDHNRQSLSPWAFRTGRVILFPSTLRQGPHGTGVGLQQSLGPALFLLTLCLHLGNAVLAEMSYQFSRYALDWGPPVRSPRRLLVSTGYLTYPRKGFRTRRRNRSAQPVLAPMMAFSNPFSWRGRTLTETVGAFLRYQQARNVTSSVLCAKPPPERHWHRTFHSLEQRPRNRW